jgi:hypothetical protein
MLSESEILQLGSELATQLSVRGPGAIDALISSPELRAKLKEVASGSKAQSTGALTQALKQGLISGTTNTAFFGVLGGIPGAVQGVSRAVPGAVQGYMNGKRDQQLKEILEVLRSRGAV